MSYAPLPDVSQMENSTENSPTLQRVEYFSKPVGVYDCNEKKIVLLIFTRKTSDIEIGQ